MFQNIYAPMFYGTSPEIFRRAAILRKRMTPAEKVLWQRLKNRDLLGYNFRRQHPMGRFIADFYCHPVKLVIELDGSIHQKYDVIIRDMERSKMMESWGITILRFENDRVLDNIEYVMTTIVKQIDLIKTNKVDL